MGSEREPQPKKWQVPAAMLGAALMVSYSMDVRDDWDDRAARQPTTSTTPSTTLASPPTETLATTTTRPAASTTSPEVMQNAISLATGPLIRGRGMLFDAKRSAGVACEANALPANRTNSLRLPLDLGPDAESHNPFAAIERAVFLGREIDRSFVSYALSDGVAFVLDGGQFKLFTFSIAASGPALATARGTIVRPVSRTELLHPDGVSFNTETLAFTVRINEKAALREQLELTIRCN